MAAENDIASAIVAELCARTAAGGGRLGAFSEGVPELGVKEFLDRLQAETETPIRVAVLGTKNGRAVSYSKLKVTFDPVEANKWRNDLEARNGLPLVVLALGPAPKLNSLRGVLPNIKSEDVRRALIRRCKEAQKTTGRGLFLDAVFERTDEFSTSQIIRYAVALDGLRAQGKAALLAREVGVLTVLGLLPSARLLGAGSLAEARKAVRANVDFRQRLASLSAKTRDGLVRLAEAKEAFSDRAERILRFENTGTLDALGDLSVEQIEETLKSLPSEGPGPAPRSRQQRARKEGDALALDLMLQHEGHGIRAAAERFGNSVEPDPQGEIEAEEIQVGSATVLPRPRSGTTQAANTFGKLVSSDNWGAVITAPAATDALTALRAVGSGETTVDLFVPEQDQDVAWTLRRAVARGMVKPDVLTRWEKYASLRGELLSSSLVPLIDHPLLALGGDKKLRENVEGLLASYGDALRAVQETADALDAQGSDQAASRLLAAAARLDLVFVNHSLGWSAIASPTHPFHLWRWLTLYSLLENHGEELRQIGEEVLEPLISNPLASTPPVVLSQFAPRVRLDRPRAFVASGSLGSLPMFAEPASVAGAPGRMRSISKIAERLLRLMPHAGLGLRVALIDPPSVSACLEDLLQVQSPMTERPVSLHLLVVRTRVRRDRTEEEEDSLAFLARELADSGGTLELAPAVDSLAAVAEHVQRFRPHLSTVFYPGQPERITVGIARPPRLSPLIAPRVYEYDDFDDRFEVIVAGHDDRFGGYHDIFCKSLGIPRDDFVGSRSGASGSAADLEGIALHSVWMTLVDESVEPTLRVAGAQRIDWRLDGGRDVVTFTARSGPTEALLDDALRVSGLVASEDARKRMLLDLFELNGEAILALARATPGATLVDPRVGKAAIGVLAAARWYRTKHPDALVISLDEQTSRHWILGVGSDDRHGDLIGVRLGQKGVIVDAIEVKAHDDPSSQLVVSGAKFRGRAAEQVDQTIAILEKVLDKKLTSPIMRARQDVLRDQLYRAVASRQYSQDRRSRFDKLLRQLFEDGPAGIGGAIFIVSIDATRKSTADDPIAGQLPSKRPATLVRLVEGSDLTKVRARPAGAAKRPAVQPGGGAPAEAEVHGPPEAGGEALTVRPKPERAVADVVGVPVEVPPSNPDEADTAALSVVVGHAMDGSEVRWAPSAPDGPLNNFGFLITGDSGNGKTSVIMTILEDAIGAGIPVCIFDFKNDYADKPNYFARECGIDVHDIERLGIPFNPLSLISDDQGQCRPINQVHELSAILARIFGLQAQQQARLRRAMTDAYTARGIRPDERVQVANVTECPSFSDVRALLEHDDKNEALLNRLSPLFDLNLFPEEGDVSTTFEGMLSKSIVLRMHTLPGDKIKAAIAEFIIVRLHAHMLRGGQPRKLRRLLVLDEAWRVRESVRLQELCREGRAFGVGVIIGTQFPGDIPEELSGSLASQLLLGNSSVEHRKSVVKTLCGATSGAEAARLMQQSAVLQKWEGFFRNQHYAPYVLMKAVPYHLRKLRR